MDYGLQWIRLYEICEAIKDIVVIYIIYISYTEKPINDYHVNLPILSSLKHDRLQPP